MSRSAFTVSRTVSLSPACKAVFREPCFPSSQYSRTIETPLPFAGSTLSISSRYCAYTAPQPIPVPDFETTTRSTRVSVPVSVFRVYPKASSGVRTSILPATAFIFPFTCNCLPEPFKKAYTASAVAIPLSHT